jgi:hypothetical protein
VALKRVLTLMNIQKGFFTIKNLAFEQKGNGGKMGPNTTFPPTCIFEIQKCQI